MDPAGLPAHPPRRAWPKAKEFMVIRPGCESTQGWTRTRKGSRATSHDHWMNTVWHWMFSGSRSPGRRACAVRGRKSADGRPDWHPGRSCHAGTRWVT